MNFSTVSITIRPLKIDGFVRKITDVQNSMRAMSASMHGKPQPPRRPYPKRHSGLTARQYRAGRRAYHRANQAHRKAVREWEAKGRPGAFTAMARTIGTLHKGSQP